MKTLLSLVAFIFLNLVNIRAQQITIGGKVGNRPLVWSDFTGTPDQSSLYYANTFWNINYGYSDEDFKGNNVTIKDLAVNLQFVNDKSWKKEDKVSDALLKHEQGHFDIAILCQLEIISLVKNASLHKDDYKAQIKNIFRGSLQKYTALEDKYDVETSHSMNKDQQEEWNKFILSEKELLLKKQ
ncbi:MAG: hypothetical protein ABIP30_03110 [Ferruginibacter sp.]